MINNKEQAYKIRNSICTYASRSKLYKRFKIKCQKDIVKIKNAIQQGMIELHYQSKGGISQFHNFKIYCSENDLPMMEALEHIMAWYLKKNV